jgi:protein-disulfide isomerase
LLAVDAGAECAEFLLEERLINPVRSILRQRNRGCVREVGNAETRPRPVGRLFDQHGTDRIAEHIAQDREEMAILLNGKAFEASLPHVSMTAVMPMVAADMTGHPPLHEGAQRSLCGRLHDEMKMIGHEAEAKEFDRVFGFCRGQQIEACGVVALFVKHRRAAISTIQDMVGVTSDLTTRNPRHERRSVGEERARRQAKSSLSPFLALVLLLLGISSVHAETLASAPLAEVNGETVTSEDLDHALGVKLTKLQEQIYALKRVELDAQIGQRLLAQEANKRGVSVAALLDSEVTAKVGLVTETEIEAFIQENRSQLKGDGAEIRDKIRASLQQRKLAEQRNQYVQLLRVQGTVVDRLQPPPVVRVQVSTDGAPIRGTADAPVTVVEFSDFHCPFCKRVQPTLTQVLEKYPGKVRLLFRHLPLDALHPQARSAAEASWCAQDQGKFWEYHDLLFANAPQAARDDLKHYAEEIDLDVSKFESCLSQNAHRDSVQRDIDEVNKLGVSGTPAFFINGRPLSGAQPLERFIQVIDEELTRATVGSVSLRTQ